MHDVSTRQLPVLLVLLLLSCSPWVVAEVPEPAPAAQELQAARGLELQLTLQDSSAEAWSKLGAVYAGLSAKYPQDPAVRDAYGEFFWKRGEGEKALVQWRAAEQINPAYAPALAHLGASCLAAGAARPAAAYYERAVASEPTNAAYQFSLANISFLFRHELLDAGQPDAEAVLCRALEHFSKASGLAPQNAEYARAYAETFYSLAHPDWTAALGAWQHFLEVSPQTDFALLNLARVHLQLRQAPEARACLARIQNPNVDRVKKRLQERISEELGPAPTVMPSKN